MDSQEDRAAELLAKLIYIRQQFSSSTNTTETNYLLNQRSDVIEKAVEFLLSEYIDKSEENKDFLSGAKKMGTSK